jgi:hypothetical protein
MYHLASAEQPASSHLHPVSNICNLSKPFIAFITTSNAQFVLLHFLTRGKKVIRFFWKLHRAGIHITLQVQVLGYRQAGASAVPSEFPRFGRSARAALQVSRYRVTFE